MDAASPIARRLIDPAIALSTAIVILALSIVPFLSPGWVAFEQDRAQAAAWTGYTPAELRTVSNSILGDLVLGHGDFDVSLDGSPVLTEAERSHMRDVRGVFAGLAVLALAGAITLIAAASRLRDPTSRARAWRAARRGATTLAVAVAAVGFLAVVAFDAAFEVFHRLFFASGTYDFDPRTSRLVQLFPEAFWFETAIAVVLVMIAAAIGVAWYARRRAIVASRPTSERTLAMPTAPASPSAPTAPTGAGR